MDMTTDEYIDKFLLNNNFIRRSKRFYYNDKCIIQVCKNYYAVKYLNEDLRYYTENLSIPSLVGYLTWDGLLDRNYKKI